MSLLEQPRAALDLEIVPDFAALSERAAQLVAETVIRGPAARISLTTGRTTAGLYRLLRERCQAGRLDLSAAHFVSSEEYAGVGEAAPISLFGWLRRELLDPCGLAPDPTLRLVGDAPNPAAECARFDARIAALGGLDLVVQSAGVNGHFGFNEPGSPRDAPTRPVRLAASTRERNSGYWHDGARIPEQGLTMGVRPTLAARHVLLLAAGAAKAPALARALEGPIAEEYPCSLLRLAPRLTVIADEAAAGMLRR